jgi:hypothetical protein
MNNETFLGWMKNLYGTFGKPAPQLHVVTAAYQRVEGLPDRFFDFALERLQDREMLPQNLGRELRVVLWPEFLEAHPELRSHVADCPECGGLGFIIMRVATGKPNYGRDVAFQCVCRIGQDQGWTRKRIEMAGIVEYHPPAEVTQRAKEALARWGVRLGEITDSRAEQRTAHLPDAERGEMLAW